MWDEWRRKGTRSADLEPKNFGLGESERFAVYFDETFASLRCPVRTKAVTV